MSSPPHPPPTLRQPSRTKSSTSLSSRGRPKRNKSSSSLSSHHSSHHSTHTSHSTVSFAHHGKGKKRQNSHSAPRKGPFDLAFTSITGPAAAAGEDEQPSDADESEDEQQQPGTQQRPPPQRRASSSASVKAKREDKGKMERTLSTESDTTVTAVGTPPSAAAVARGRLTVAAPELKTVLGSLTSQNEGSEWESATDSPAPKTRDLEPAVEERAGRPTARQQQLSPSRQPQQQQQQQPQPAQPAERSRSKNRAKFEIGSMGASASASGERLVAPLASPHAAVLPALEKNAAFPFPETTHQQQPHPADPSQPSHTTVGFPSPVREPVRVKAQQPPPEVKPPTPPTPPQQQQQPTVAFPSSHSSPDRPPQESSRKGGRKASNASIMSTGSIRSNALSLASRRGPQLSGMRRSASGALGPQLDMHTAAGEYSSGTNLADLPHANGSASGGSHPPPVSRNHHARGESVGSMRSLRSVAENGYPRRAASHTNAGAYAAQQQRQPSGSNLSAGGSSTALSMLGHLAHANDHSPLAPPKRSASGYFSAALRGLTGLQLTPPLSSSPQSTAPSHLAPTAGSSSNLSGLKGKGRAVGSSTSPKFVAPIISKFLDEEDEPTLPLPRAPQGATPGGPLSRTQQKAYLARDAPTSASSMSLADMAGGGPAGAYYSSLGGNAAQATPPGATAQTAFAQQQQQHPGMREWASALLKDADWIDRQHRQAQRWRDPIGESLERVIQKRKQDQNKPRLAAVV